LYPNYKAGRSPSPENEEAYEKYVVFRKDFYSQKDILFNLIKLLKISLLTYPVTEGDDIIAQLTLNASSKKQLTIVSEDKDFAILVKDNVRLYRPIQDQIITLENMERVLGVPQKWFIIRKALVGGKDGITGVSGVGAVTVYEIIKKYEELYGEDEKVYFAGIQEACKAIGNKRALKVYCGNKTFVRNMELMDMSREKFSVADLSRLKRSLLESPNLELKETYKLMESLGFLSITTTFNTWMSPFKKLK